MKLNKIKLTLAAIGMMVSLPALSAVTAGTQDGVYDATENTLETSY